MSRRTEKVAALIHQEVGGFLSRLELSALTTISKVEITPDLKYGKVWVTILGNAEKQKQTLAQLRESRFDLQEELKKLLTMKIIPRISFVHDHGEEYAARINDLLRKTHESS